MKRKDPTAYSGSAQRTLAGVKQRIVTDKPCSEYEKWLFFLCCFQRITAWALFCVLFEQVLNPSIYPSSSTDWIRLMHKAPTHAIGLLMTGPYADTLTAMSNYFKYTGEGQSWADLWEVKRGQERAERGWWNKRKQTQSTFFYLRNRFELNYTNCSFRFMTKITMTICSFHVDGGCGTWRHRWFLPVRPSSVCLSFRFQADLPGLFVLHYKLCPCCCVFLPALLFFS